MKVFWLCAGKCCDWVTFGFGGCIAGVYCYGMIIGFIHICFTFVFVTFLTLV